MLLENERKYYAQMAPVWTPEQRTMAPVAARQCVMTLAALATGALLGMAVEHHSLVFEGIGMLLLAATAGLFGMLLGYVSARLAGRSSGSSRLGLLWPALWRALVVVATNLYLGYELGGDGFADKPWAQSGARVVLGISLALAASALLNQYLWARLCGRESKSETASKAVRAKR